MEIHHDTLVLGVDMHVRRSDVRCGRVHQDHRCLRRPEVLGVERFEFAELLGCCLGRLGDQRAVSELQAARGEDGPRAGHRVGMSEANVATLVIGEVERVGTERVVDPSGRADQRRALNVGADRRSDTRTGVSGPMIGPSPSRVSFIAAPRFRLPPPPARRRTVRRGTPAQ